MVTDVTFGGQVRVHQGTELNIGGTAIIKDVGVHSDGTIRMDATSLGGNRRRAQSISR